MLEFGVDRSLHEQHVEHRAFRPRLALNPPVSVADGGDQHDGGGQARQDGRTNALARRHRGDGLGQTGGHGHHHAPHTNRPQAISHLDERGPSPLGVSQSAEREASQHRAAEVLAGHPCHGRRHHQRPPPAMHQPAGDRDEEWQGAGQIGRECHPADRRRGVW